MEPSLMIGNPGIHSQTCFGGEKGQETHPDEQSDSLETRYPDLIRDRYLAVKGDPIRSVVLITPPRNTGS